MHATMKGIAVTSKQFSTWEREVFRILADQNSTLVDINTVLATTPAEISETVHRITLTAVELKSQEQAPEFPAQFTNATQVPETRPVLQALAFSQNPQTWSTDPEVFAKHMELADALTDETSIKDEKDFLMLAWDILSDIREHLGETDTDALDFEKFDYLVNHIEELANI